MPGTEFPAFLKLEYRRDQSAGRAMLADIDDTLGQAERRFGEFGEEAKRQLDAALSVNRNSFGALDVGVDQARSVAAALKQRATAAREVAAATATAAREAGDYSQQARLTVAAAEALAIEEERAAASALSHAKALEQVQGVLSRQASAVSAVIGSTRRGIAANDESTAGLARNRTAMVQAGQQLQDMAIQFQAGTRASAIFAQQLPQLAFAFSNVEGRAGAVARFLSGPWSLALVAGSALFGGLIDKLLSGSDAADKVGSATAALKDRLDLAKNSYESLIGVVNEYNQAQDKSTALTYGAIIAAEKEAKRLLDLAKARLLAAQASDPGANAGSNLEAINAATAKDSLVSFYQGQIAKLEKELTSSQIAAGTERAKRATDPRYNIEVSFNEKIVALEEQRRRNIVDQVGYEKKRIDLLNQQKAALEAFDKANRSTSRGSGEYGRQIDMAAARSIASSAGFQINSATRPTWIRDEVKGSGVSSQERLYNQWVAAGKPSDNPVAVPGTSAHERGNALDIQIRSGVTAESIRKAYAAEGVRLTKIFKERGHYHIEWSTSGADKVEREAERLATFGEQAAEKIARINAQFDAQPRLIDQANAATRELDRTIADLQERKPIDWQKSIADAEAAKQTIKEALERPFAELQRDSERRMEVARLITAGRQDEAEALQVVWQLERSVTEIDEQRHDAILAMVRAERALNDELASRQEIVGSYLDATRAARGEIEAILSGSGNPANFQTIFKQLRGKVLTEQIFGQSLRGLEDYVRRNTFEPAVDNITKQTDRASLAVESFADAVTGATARISNPIGAKAAGSDLEAAFDAAFARNAASAANDNPPPGGSWTGDGWTIEAPKNSVMGITPDSYSVLLGEAISKPMIKALEKAFGQQLPAGLSQALAGAFGGYMTGGPIGAGLGLLSSIPGLGGSGGLFGKALGGLQSGSLLAGIGNSFGLGLSSNGAGIGGAIGSIFPGLGSLAGSLIGGIAGGKGTAGMIGGGLGGLAGYFGVSALMSGGLGAALGLSGGLLGTLGAAAGPIGAVVGALLGSVLGGLFGKRPRGAGSVTNSSVYASANDSGVTGNLNTIGGSLQQAVQKIADAFGTTVGNYSVGIGQYKEYYQVSGQAGDPYLGNSYFQQNSAYDLYDGTDAEAAMRAAVLGALQDGAIQGIKAGAQRLLTAGKDLDAQIQKALDFQSVFDRLKSYTDPVGYALDKLNKEFTHLKAIFAEAGASAEEYAQLEQLYGIERAKAIEEATSRVGTSLRGLYQDLTIGDSGLSLRDRRANALAAYQPLAERVQAGDTSAYDDFATAARTLLDLQRQISGSQTGYFDLYGEIRDLTKSAIDATTAVNGTASGYPSPFTNTANDNAAVVSNLQGLATRLDAVNQNLGTIILQGNLTGTDGLSRLLTSKGYF